MVPVSDNSSSSSTNVGAIVGGVVGGVGGLAAIMFIAWLILYASQFTISLPGMCADLAFRRRRNKYNDDDDDFKWPPMAITHEKPGRGGTTALDEPAAAPTPFNAYQYGALPTGPGTPAPVEGTNGLSSPSESYPNPWSAPATAEGVSHPALTSEGSVYSGTALSSGDHHNVSPHRALQIRNPTPGVPLASFADVKDRTVLLSANGGLQVFGGQPAASGSASAPTTASTSAPGLSTPPTSAEAAAFGQGGSSATSDSAGSSSVPFVHQDAGVVPGSQPQRPTKAAEASADATAHVDAPPAYEE